MKYAYIYFKLKDYKNCIKYGLKLSEHVNKSIIFNNCEKKGIICYISPKDSCLYDNPDYACAKINISDLNNVYVIDDTFENYKFYNEFIVEAKDYVLGSFENPKILVCTSIIPENIDKYNKLIDSPLPYDNSKDFYYLKKIYYILEEKNVDLKKSLSYLLQSMVDSKSAEYFSNQDKSIQIFIDNDTKKYTVCK